MEEGGWLRSRRARGVRLRRHDAVGRRTREGEAASEGEIERETERDRARGGEEWGSSRGSPWRR